MPFLTGFWWVSWWMPVGVPCEDAGILGFGWSFPRERPQCRWELLVDISKRISWSTPLHWWRVRPLLQEFWNLDPLEPNSWGKHFDLVFIVCSSALLVFAFNFRPVIIEVPHFASLRGKEREIVILRSDNGETWREHTLEATEEAVQEVLQESFDPDGKNHRKKVTIVN